MWKPIKKFRGKTSAFNDQKQVDLWLQVRASPRSMGWADAFRVVNCWKKDAKWFHLHDGKEKELEADYITHWMHVPRPPNRSAA